MVPQRRPPWSPFFNVECAVVAHSRPKLGAQRMELALIVAAIAIVLWLSIKATVQIARDGLIEGRQKAAQLALVWLLPLVGAILVLAVNRPPEAPSRKYRERPDAGEDFTASGRSVKAITEAVDGD